MTDLKITKAIVLTNQHGTDTVMLRTNLPGPFPPGVGDTHLHLHFEAQAGTGEGYVQEHLGIVPEVVDAKTGERR